MLTERDLAVRSPIAPIGEGSDRRMQGLARKLMDDGEEAPEAIRQPQVRPDELRILEALLFASKEPLDEKTLAQRLPEGVDLAQTIAMLKDEYAPRGVNLVKVNGK